MGEFPSKWRHHNYDQKELSKRQVHTDLLSPPLPVWHDEDEQQLNCCWLGLCQRELGQFFGEVARWANRLYKSDSEVNLFEEDSEFDTAQKFFEFFNEDQQEAKCECTPTVSAWAVPR